MVLFIRVFGMCVLCAVLIGHYRYETYSSRRPAFAIWRMNTPSIILLWPHNKTKLKTCPLIWNFYLIMVRTLYERWLSPAICEWIWANDGNKMVDFQWRFDTINGLIRLINVHKESIDFRNRFNSFSPQSTQFVETSMTDGRISPKPPINIRNITNIWEKNLQNTQWKQHRKCFQNKKGFQN